MNTPENHLQIEFDLQVSPCPADTQKLETLVRSICEKFQVHEAAIQIAIVDDAGIIEVHRRFLQKDTTTDVISFDLSDEFEPGRSFQIVVNAEMAARQANNRGHNSEAELALYITHGLLHNLGYDDLTDDEAQKMHETEDMLLKQLGFGIIYSRNETETTGD